MISLVLFKFGILLSCQTSNNFRNVFLICFQLIIATTSWKVNHERGINLFPASVPFLEHYIPETFLLLKSLKIKLLTFFLVLFRVFSGIADSFRLFFHFLYENSYMSKYGIFLKIWSLDNYDIKLNGSWVLMFSKNLKVKEC